MCHLVAKYYMCQERYYQLQQLLLPHASHLQNENFSGASFKRFYEITQKLVRNRRVIHLLMYII